MASIEDLLQEGANALREAGLDEPRREARLLLAHALGVSLTDLVRAPRQQVAPACFRAMLARRAAREPLALITGRAGFWSLDLAVSPDTLIPRADSEALIDAALNCFPDRKAVRRVLDLGTGTGCLLLAALSEFPEAFGVGVDLAPAAAALAARNAAANGLAGRAAFLAGNWAAALSGTFDLILSNPPYIASEEISGLMPEVARHEPRRALDGGADGLTAYRALMPAIAAQLAPGGAAILELGQGQAKDTAALAKAAGFTHISAEPDLAGVERALVLRR
jgi:release factor glutamine methyltransferase